MGISPYMVYSHNFGINLRNYQQFFWGDCLESIIEFNITLAVDFYKLCLLKNNLSVSIYNYYMPPKGASSFFEVLKGAGRPTR